MSLTDMLAQMSTEMMNEHLEKVKSDPEKYDKVLQMTLKATELGIVYLRESREFREAFARIHAEFFKYPESREFIKAALNAYSQHKQ